MTRNDQAQRLRKRPLGRYRYVRLRWRVLFTLIDFVGGVVFSVASVAREALRSGFRCMATKVKNAAGVARPLNGEVEQPGVILLVQLDHLGDAVMTRTMMPALRARYPRASIEVLVGAWNRQLFEAMPEVDVVHASRVNRFSRTGRFGWMVATVCWGLWLRRRRVDLAIDIRGEFPLALVLWLSGARRRVGWNAGGGGFLLTDSAGYVPDRPEVDSRWALLRELGIEPEPEQSPPWPAFAPPDEDRTHIDHRLAAVVADRPGRRPIVLHVGAGSEAKRWPVGHWRALAHRLTTEEEHPVVLVGGRGDRAIAHQIIEAGPTAGLFDWTGQLNIVELAALLERSALLIGADSGPAHLAAAVGTPVIALFSGTNRTAQWRPRGRSVTVLQRQVVCRPCHRSRCGLADHPCMRGIEPDTVWAAVRQLLDTVDPTQKTHQDLLTSVNATERPTAPAGGPSFGHARAPASDATRKGVRR